ncbi:ParA family protein [Vibrio cholerae]|uniref:ParA family protein n=1 Tax=Vibrio fluvialis TaxID=676 RepID=UPI002573F372|nr:ParA family protein [Vibrio fluvialis]EGR4422225.1 ParA family protein [Vibrio cholerae]BEI26535.1 ParA family protein [Vibrio fluvialis]
MSAISESIRHTANNMSKEQSNLEEALKSQLRVNVTDEDLIDGVDRLIYNHSLNKTQVIKQLRTTKPTFAKKLAEAEKMGLIGEHTSQGVQHLYTNEQVHILMEHFGVPKYHERHDGKLVVVMNHKGGCGKTSTTLVLATATALDLDLNARVLVLDLDPQGSAGQGTMRVAEDSIYVTMTDILLAEFEPDNEENAVNALLASGYTLEEIIKQCAFSTHLANLSVITAFPSDERFVDTYWQLKEDEQSRLLRKFSEVVLPVLKEEFDIIYVDMPPQDSPITWSALEAAEMLLVPVTPRYYDYVSTTNFMSNLSERLSLLPSKGSNLQWYKVAAVNYQESSKPEYDTFQKLMRSVRNNLMTATIAHSDAFTATAAIGRTVLDIKKSEDVCSKTQFDVAVDSVKVFYKQFKNELVQVAAK